MGVHRTQPKPDEYYTPALPEELTGLVVRNDDPDHQGRVQVIIPAIDESEVCPLWIRPLTGAASAAGHGFASIPGVGVEVALTARGRGKHELFYSTLYNEEAPHPEDIQDETCAVMRFPADLKIICDGDLMLQGGRILAKAEWGTVQIKGASGVILDPEDDGEGV